MNIEVDTNISKEHKGIKVSITAPEFNDDVQNILNSLSTVSENRNIIVATKNNELFLLKASDILYFYSDEKYIYAKTKEVGYKVKQKMYELEECLPTNKYIRISSAYIINIDKTVSFDMGQIGSLYAKMEDGKKLEVSKRRIKEVKKFLTERK